MHKKMEFHKIEDSPSNRTFCKMCGDNICKGDKRLKLYGGISRYGGSIYEYCCTKKSCATEWIDLNIKEKKEEINKLIKHLEYLENLKK